MLYTLIIKTIGLSLIAHVVALEKSQALTSDESGVRSQTNGRRRRNAEDDITSEDIQNIVDLTNQYRRNVVPGSASDMQHLEWNDELADLAQQWADRCSFSHGTVDNDYPDPIEQNLDTNELADNNLPDNFITESIESWNSNGNYYDYNSSTCDPGRHCYLYHKQVWASANSIGCGIKSCTYLERNIGFFNCYFAPVQG
ncbi:peptidase inhibitor 16-like [Antedon mediterranea]|uniref:peptidase inhibitor 16-like n=1 Tax=Antedon mediterranea TaxID=105859 RepID=UPI003AF436F2